MLFNNKNLEKYDINDFFIGELIFTERQDKSSSKINLFDIKDKKSILFNNGAIEIEVSNYILDNNDWSKKIKYHKVLTIFYKINDGYLCLHDGNVYKTNNEYFCNNLVTLSSMLPKVGYNIPKQITMTKALFMFEQLFNQSISLEKIYNNNKYKTSDFYIGKLALHTGFLPQGKRLYPEQTNIPIKYILSKSTKMTGLFSITKTEDILTDSEIIPGKYLYTNYKCLFLKLPNGLYNINNFQIYKKGLLERTSFKERPIGESYYEKITPITDEIEGIKETKLSIPKVLTRIKKN